MKEEIVGIRRTHQRHGCIRSNERLCFSRQIQTTLTTPKNRSKTSMLMECVLNDFRPITVFHMNILPDSIELSRERFNFFIIYWSGEIGRSKISIPVLQKIMERLSSPDFFTNASTFANAPKISDKNPALPAEHLNPLEGIQFFRQNTSTFGQKPGAADNIALIFAIRAGFLLNYPMRKSKENGRITKEHGEIVKGHGQMAIECGEIAKGHGRMAKERGEIAMGHGRMAKGHGEIVRGHWRMVKEHEEIARGHREIAKEHAWKFDWLFRKCNQHKLMLNQHEWSAKQHAWDSPLPTILAKQLRLIMISAYLPKNNSYFLSTI